MLAAITAAVQLAWPRPAPADEHDPVHEPWRFSGRWWHKPVPLRARPALGAPLTVYVDDWRQRAVVRDRADRWSHLLADDPEELHAMAAALGIPPRGYQRHRRSAALNHYDVPESLRLRAIELGAVAVTWREMARLTRAVAARWRSASATRSSMMRSKE